MRHGLERGGHVRVGTGERRGHCGCVTGLTVVMKHETAVCCVGVWLTLSDLAWSTSPRVGDEGGGVSERESDSCQSWNTPACYSTH